MSLDRLALTVSMKEMNDDDNKFTWEELDLIRYFLVENKKEFTEFATEFGDDEDVVEEILSKLWGAMEELYEQSRRQ